MSDVTVIGLGAMGTALARTLIDAGRNVTVWNRSAKKMEPLVALGAQGPSDFGKALAASPRVIICISDYKTTAELFEQSDVTPVLNGRTVVQLSTGTPKEAKDSEEWFNGFGASYLDGAILCWPRNIGTPSGLILVAGQKPTLEYCETDLRHLAGDLRYLGSNIGVPSTLDLAWLSRLMGVVFGSIHGALVCESEGVPVSEFTALLPPNDRAVPLTQTINDGTFANVSKGGATVDVASGALARIRQQANDAGINCELPDLLYDLVKRAEKAGYGSEETAAIIKVLRQGGSF